MLVVQRSDTLNSSFAGHTDVAYEGDTTLPLYALFKVVQHDKFHLWNLQIRIYRCSLINNWLLKARAFNNIP